MIDRLDLLEKRYEEINNLLMQNEVISDVKKSRELSIELKSIEETVTVYRKYKKVLSDIEESKEMLHDPEIADYAREELNRLNEEEVKLFEELKNAQKEFVQPCGCLSDVLHRITHNYTKCYFGFSLNHWSIRSFLAV